MLIDNSTLINRKKNEVALEDVLKVLHLVTKRFRFLQIPTLRDNLIVFPPLKRGVGGIKKSLKSQPTTSQTTSYLKQLSSFLLMTHLLLI